MRVPKSYLFGCRGSTLGVYFHMCALVFNLIVGGLWYSIRWQEKRKETFNGLKTTNKYAEGNLTRCMTRSVYFYAASPTAHPHPTPATSRSLRTTCGAIPAVLEHQGLDFENLLLLLRPSMSCARPRNCRYRCRHPDAKAEPVSSSGDADRAVDDAVCRRLAAFRRRACPPGGSPPWWPLQRGWC